MKVDKGLMRLCRKLSWYNREKLYRSLTMRKVHVYLGGGPK